ncbi:Pfs, NACHT and Ankyrin domain protein [Daldinia childiae]|uniref:Pfs, NACHT and Ankyrin domain protein n=1 Tax=Daldinia childiae TaxID=326645 RepID=UPI00144861F4|nr:Pfs, NACHT and Ankyrin domain protein [Daldinia childiae]KAF3054955.1 Pfs, NACHT and Ankyrin domain protein [Daldinia childiae]
MPERTIKVYKADNSGLGSKPLQGSNVEPDSRPFHVTHKDLTYGLTGPGLGPNVRRYIGGYAKHVQLYGDGRLCKTSPHSSGWIEFPDLFHFTQHTVGCAIISAHFGSDLLRIHSGFMDDLWAVDAGFPWFARCVPRFLRPGPYRARDRLISNLMDWYAYARDRFDGSAIDEDGDGDPAWGSGLSRRRQKTLREIREHDDRAIASLDLGHSWGLTKTLGTNRIHNKPNDSQPDKNILDLLDPKVLQSNSLLCSIYAETLRLHGTSHLIFRASADAHLGRWLLPRGSIGLISPGVLHQDAKFWNTCDGQHPISEFWSDRFLVYPNDPNSGPVSPVYRDISYSSPKKRQDNVDNDNNQPYFTMDGTEGAWYPYGGGEGICLGRFLAKNSILATLAYLVLEFDIEPQVESMVVNSWRFGLSVNQPRYTTPFKIRRRPSDKE